MNSAKRHSSERSFAKTPFAKTLFVKMSFVKMSVYCFLFIAVQLTSLAQGKKKSLLKTDKENNL